MSTLRATLLGIAAYFGLGLAVIALILACVLLGALGHWRGDCGGGWGGGRRYHECAAQKAGG